MIKISKPIVITIAIICALSLFAAVYLSFFYMPSCQNFECFQKAMIKCSKAVYINEAPEASWEYTLRKGNSESCSVEVLLLQAKKGELGMESLEGTSMICTVPMGSKEYPEKDLNSCHGILKEELQTVVINKLHSYLLENIGKFDEGLKSSI